MTRICRSIAPLRLGLAGGGTDVSPYCDEFGGLVLNATINQYAHCTIIPTDEKKIVFEAQDLQVSEEYSLGSLPANGGGLALHRAVHLYMREKHPDASYSGALVSTYCDAPPGSGLGASSTVVVSMVQAYAEWLGLPLGEYDVARYAYTIERIRLPIAGGRQDQYAAAFGGFNFIEFHPNDFVTVNPLRVKQWIVNELQESLLLFYSSVSRESKHIIEQQVSNVESSNQAAIEATHKLRAGAIEMKDALLKGDLRRIGKILEGSWSAKRNLAVGITNSRLDNILDVAIKAGAMAGKVSGAGGGGFVMLLVPPEKRRRVERALEVCEGSCLPFRFSHEGAQAWSVYQ
jgi:D-glycero-alpha-D-manno-heptose-7-phosphate kinase